MKPRFKYVVSLEVPNTVTDFDLTDELYKEAEAMGNVLKDGTCLVSKPTVNDINQVEFEVEVHR